MAVADFNTYVREKTGGIGAGGSPISYKYSTPGSGGDIEQGEFTAWDKTNKIVVRFNRTGGAGKFTGISRDSAKGFRKLGNQDPLGITDMSVYTSGIHLLLGTVGETVVHGDPVYMNATSTIQVTKTQGSNGVQLGVVWLPDGTSKVGAVRVPVLIDTFTATQV